MFYCLVCSIRVTFTFFQKAVLFWGFTKHSDSLLPWILFHKESLHTIKSEPIFLMVNAQFLQLNNRSIRCIPQQILVEWINKWMIKKSHECESGSIVSISLQPWTVPHQPPLSMNSPGKNTGVGSLSPLQVIFQTQGSNVGLTHCRQILYHLSHQGHSFISGIRVNTEETNKIQSIKDI